MRKPTVRFHWFVTPLVLAIAVFFLSGCDDTAIISCPEDTQWYQHFECRTSRLACGVTTVSLTPNVDVQTIPDLDMYAGLWLGATKTYGLYTDPEFKDVVFTGNGLTDLKGSVVLKTNNHDSTSTSPAFLYIKLLKEVEGFYLAYDSRVVSPPAWLKQGYEKEGLVPISLSDSRGLINLQVWRKKSLPPTGGTVIIPGNSNGLAAGWNSNLLSGDPPLLMYVIMIKPMSIVDCSSTQTFPLDTLVYEDYISSDHAQKDAESEALSRCERSIDKGSQTCDSPICTLIGLECRELERHAFQYPLKSLIEFTPASGVAVTMTIGEHDYGYASGITGTLNFEYLPLANNAFQVDGMALQADALDTKAGRFDEIAVVLSNPTTVLCMDSLHVYSMPCTHYQIPRNGTEEIVSAKLEGKPVVWSARNLHPISIVVDHQKRSFQYSGSVEALIETTGQPIPLDIDYELDGYFVNFAPKALVKFEGPQYAECRADINLEPIRLYATDSFDVYAPNPNKLPRYEWYEDFGLTTEHLWGISPTLTITANQLAYGVHSFTLLVGDNYGAIDLDNFEVEVRDTVPPILRVPPDVITPILPRGTKNARIEIGQAWASDRNGCALADPIITNDAPEDRIFPAGVTTVTWRADDVRGNVTTAVQQVNVRVLALPYDYTQPWAWPCRPLKPVPEN